LREEGEPSCGSRRVLNTFNRGSDHLAALDRVKVWTRARFELPEHATILVSEVTCALPGCPPLHTVIVFWSDDATRHQLKLFKTVVEVTLDDLPPAWMKPALVALDGIDDACC
jgi:nitrate reductase delta subunit